MGSPAGGVEVPARRIEARLLVVEDDPTILELLSGSLRFRGLSLEGRQCLSDRRKSGRQSKL